jgi:DNA polymerase-3 subunit chi
MTKIEFIKLDRAERAGLLCELAEEFHLKDQRVLVMVQDENQGVTLDRFMWSWNKGSFLPHVYDNGSVECVDEPVVIATREDNPNGSQVLIMGRPCSLDFIRQFRHVIDFAEVYDEELRQVSRERFLSYKDAGLEPRLR